jgi:hypothetical protein
MIRATANDGSLVYGVSGTITVTPPDVPVTSVTVSSAGGVTSVVSGTTLQLTATVEPSNASNPAVTWSGSSGSGATVNSSGLVSGTGPGSVTIRATSNSNNDKYGSIALTVTSADVTKVTGESGFEYTVRCYSNNRGCWTENIKEAGQSQTTYTGYGAGERGYYYSWANAAAACSKVPGYSLPTEAQWNAMKSYINGSPTADDKNFFTSGSALAGLTNGSGAWGSWGTSGRWWSSGATNQYFSTIGSTLNGQYTGSLYYFSVRCVQSN